MDHTDYRNNPQYRAQVRTRMSILLTCFLTGEISVIEVARALSPYSDLPEPAFRPHLDTFVGIDSETDALPVGAVRHHWAQETLLQKDKEIAAAEYRWREEAQVAASHLTWLISSSN
jgi:hypothetical protein